MHGRAGRFHRDLPARPFCIKQYLILGICNTQTLCYNWRRQPARFGRRQARPRALRFASLMTDLSLSAPVLVVDDEPLVRQRILRLLADLGYSPSALVACATLAEARFHLDSGARFPFALIDLGLPDGSGLELIEILHARDAQAGILVISTCTTEDVILAALKLGASGYVLKERDDQEIAMSVRSALRGGAPIDPFVARRLLALLPPPASPAPAPAEAPLSKREREILELVAQGHTNREIAEQLFVSPHTAACHIKNIYRKLAVTSRTRAIHEARSLGLL